MGWRTVAITRRAKLDLQLGHLVVRNDDVIKINIDEISVLLIECTAVSLTAALLAELTRKKVKVIFCDEKRLPSSELVSYYGSHDTSLKYRKQASWTVESKRNVWTEIVKEKIYQQMNLLDEYDRGEAALLNQYLGEIKPGDVTNREGHAAKVYFNAMFGMDFSRTQEVPLNAALNYGYSIILSAVAKEIVSLGYCTQLGICHDNQFNPLNYACDLMEPFRILVDRQAADMQITEFDSKVKYQLLDVLNQEVRINGNKEYVSKAIRIYVKSVCDAIEEQDLTFLKFYRYEK